MANSTAETIIGLARNLLRSESTSDVPVIQDAFMLAALSDGNMKYARAFRRGGGVGPIVFTRETGDDVAADTALAENVTPDTTDFDVDDASDQETTADGGGAVVIWDGDLPDIATHSGKTGNNLTGVSGIGFDHEDGDEVQKLYKLPSNFGFWREWDGSDGVKLNGLPLKFTDGPPRSGFFSMHDTGTDKYLWLPRDSSGEWSGRYDKASTAIDSLDDIVDVPPEHQFCLVWWLVAFGLAGRDGLGDKAIAAEQKGDAILYEALKDRNIGKFVRPRPIRPHNPMYGDPSLYRPSNG